MPLRPIGLTMLALVLVAACAAPAARPTSGDSDRSEPQGTGPRTVRIADRHEPTDLFPKIPAMGGSNRTKRLFNASLALMDAKGDVVPYLAESLPQINSDSWRVSPDGRMETTFRLRPNLTWHDGRPLTAEDFVFALRVYTHPSLGIFTPVPQDKVEEMVAVDSRTLVIRWKTLYPDAAALVPDTLDPLPRHILEQPLAAVDQDATAREMFLNLPFWTTEYVGAGAYRLDRWNQGIALEGSAFDGHALGRPRIDRVIERIFPSENTILANVLAGEIDFATRTTLRFVHGQTIEREWVAAGRGRTILEETAPLAPLVQFRPEYQKTVGLLDLRVRKAFAHGLDKRSILDALYEGQGHTADTPLSLKEPYYADLDRAIAKYPYDARRVEQYMNEAGYTRDRDGFFVDGRGDRFRPDYQVLTNVDSERVQIVIADGLRRAGVDVQTNVLPAELVRDDQVRQTFTGMSMPGSGAVNERSQLPFMTSAQIGWPTNRWKGSNRGAWINAEYDRLFDSYNSTLVRTERNQESIQMMKILSEDLPIYPLYYNLYVLAAATNLTGPDVGVPDETDYWNIHLWEMK